MRPTIGSGSVRRATILEMGRQALDARGQKPRCPHRVLSECVGTWDTTGTTMPPFDIHNCKACGTTKGVRVWQPPQLI